MDFLLRSFPRTFRWFWIMRVLIRAECMYSMRISKSVSFRCRAAPDFMQFCTKINRKARRESVWSSGSASLTVSFCGNFETRLPFLLFGFYMKTQDVSFGNQKKSVFRLFDGACIRNHGVTPAAVTEFQFSGFQFYF